MRFLLAFFALILAAGPTAEIHSQAINGSTPQRIAFTHNGQIALANTLNVQRMVTKDVQVENIKPGTLILALPQPAPLPTPPTMAPAVPGAVALAPGEV